MRWFVVMILVVCSGGGAFAAVPQARPLRLTLAQALQRAQTVSVGILVADARVDQAIARLSQARSSLLPQIDGSVAGARQTRDLRGTGFNFSGLDPHVGPFNSFDARGKITQAIFDAAAIERLRTAKLGKELSASELRKAREDALALIATMYIQAQRAQEHVQLTRVFLKRDQKVLALARVQFKQGTGSFLDLKKAEADYAQSRYLYRGALADSKERCLDVAAALKVPSSVPIIFVESDHRFVLEKTDGGNTKEISADVKVAQDQLKVQKADAAAARADYLPKVTAVGDYGRGGSAPDRGSNTYTIGVQASIPIWEGGNKQAKAAEAQAKIREGEAVVDDTQRQTEARIISAHESIAATDALIGARNADLSVADEQMKLVMGRLHSGTAHNLDVDITAAQQAFVKDQRREAVALLWMAKISLAHALGQMGSLAETR